MRQPNCVLPWYAVKVKPRHEKVVAACLLTKGFTGFLPLYSARRRSAHSDGQLPLFPGYVFCRFDILRRLPILTTPGVLLIVRNGDGFCPVNEREIASIQTIVSSGLAVRPLRFLKAGDRVHVEQGPFRGVDGILLNTGDQHHLVVSVPLLRRSVAVEIDPRWVRPDNRGV